MAKLKHGNWTGVQVEVNSTFIRKSFHDNVRKGLYSTKDLILICRCIITEIAERDGKDLYTIFNLVKSKWGAYYDKNLSSKALARKYREQSKVQILDVDKIDKVFGDNDE